MRSGSLVLLATTLVCIATPVRSEGAEPPSANSATASQLYGLGLQHFRAKEFDAAAADFEAAFQSDPQPAVLYNLGLAFAAGEHPVDAVRVLNQYLESSGSTLPDARRTTVQEVLESQRKRIGTLSIHVAPIGTTISVDERVIGATPIDVLIQLPAGRHTVVAAHDGYVSSTRSLQIEPQVSTKLELTLQLAASAVVFPGAKDKVTERASAPSAVPTVRATTVREPPPDDARFRALGVASASGAIAFAALGTIFALQAHSAERRVNEAGALGARWDASYASTEAAGLRAQYAAWGCFGAAGVLAGVATWLLIWPPQAKPRVSDVAIEASPRGLALSGAVHF